MKKFEFYHDLTDRHLYYIVFSLANHKSPEAVKDGFETFFEARITGDLLLDVAAEHKDKISELRNRTPGDFGDIRIASLHNQLKMLDEIYDQAIEEKTVGVDKDGNAISKKELEIARKCVETSGKLLTQKELLDLRRKETEARIASYGSSSGNGNPPLLPDSQGSVIKYDISEPEQDSSS